MRIEQHPILTFPDRRRVTIYFEGRPVEAYEGEPIASALHAAGIRVLRWSAEMRRPRGFFCAIGNCSSCLMEVDGVPNVRVCVERVRDGMVVKQQRGKGVLPAVDGDKA